MKSLLKAALVYMIAGLAAGVYFREFTKFSGYTGLTTLSFVHTHLLVLGLFVFLLAALFARNSTLTEQKSFRRFFLFYNIGLPVAAAMLCLRGTLEVLGQSPAGAMDAAISGIAGLGHILLTIGLGFFFAALFKTFCPAKESTPTAK